MTNTNRKANRIGNNVTCPECSLTYGDHHFGCTRDPNYLTLHGKPSTSTAWTPARV